jgi:hypothetical protein
MKIILILAIATVASATFLRQANPSVWYENPWTKDANHGKCNDGEYKDMMIDTEGKTWSMCAPKRNHGNSEACPQPPNFDSSLLSAYAVEFDEFNRGCVVECSDSMHHECPSQAQCIDAPASLVTDFIKKVCYYPQHNTPPPPGPHPAATGWYEDPWTADMNDGACQKYEMVQTFHDALGHKYGHCMPVLFGNTSDCPKPPGYDELWLSAYDTKVDDLTWACAVECSDSYKHSCPRGAKCMGAPSNMLNERVKMICVYQQ